MLHPAVFWYFFNDIGTKKVYPKRFFQYFCHAHFMQKLIYTSVTKTFSIDTNMPPQRHLLNYQVKYQTSKQGGIV